MNTPPKHEQSDEARNDEHQLVGSFDEAESELSEARLPVDEQPARIDTAELEDMAPSRIATLEKPPESEIATGVIRPADRLFSGLSVGSGVLLMVIIGAIGLFLLISAWPSFFKNDENFFTFGGEWSLSDPEHMHFGLANLLFTTVVVSVIALIIAMPIALGIAIFLTSYCPKRFVATLAYIVDLLAAVPSIVYGVWGAAVLGPFLGPFFEWISRTFGSFIPFLHHDSTDPPFGTSRFLLTGGIVLAIMILPIIAATTREVFIQTPRGQIEAALALGATRWEVVRMTVLPFGKSGFISGSMLGLGRALGETMALLMVIAGGLFHGSLFNSGTTFATQIAKDVSEADSSPLKMGALIAAGLVLFVLTFIVNSAARAVIASGEK